MICLKSQKKLKNLGLVEVSSVDVVHNFSSRILTEVKSKLINKGLDFSLCSSRLDVQHIRAEFENLYSKFCNLLSTQCLMSKQKLITLYSRFVFTFFHEKRRKLSDSILSEEQKSCVGILQTY